MPDFGDSIEKFGDKWTFAGDVHKNFDAHVNKSVPFYDAGHQLILKLSDFFLPEDSICYDIGCSTGTLLTLLADKHRDRHVQFIGIDSVEEMVDAAKIKCKKFSNVTVSVCDAIEMNYEKANLICAFYTLQFVHPSIRQSLFNKIYESLNWGGAFIFFEKVRASDARFQDIMTQVYSDYKLDRGYSPDEILNKTSSLRGVLEPFSTDGNFGLARRAGFLDIISVFKYACFEGFLAIK
jgi:tRNA (cmo5U34)-methyltransferase